jgi:hypothetical protein
MLHFLRILQNKVEHILKNFPETRDSDIKLTNLIWWKFYEDYLFEDKNGDIAIRLLDIYAVPKQDNVKRIRAKLQNQKHLYLPLDPSIRKKRNILKEDWRRYLGKNPEMREVIYN